MPLNKNIYLKINIFRFPIHKFAQTEKPPKAKVAPKTKI